MDAVSYALFDTPLGTCGVVWRTRGLLAVRLPERTESEMLTQLAKSFPGATLGSPTPAVNRAIKWIVEALEGKPSDLRQVVLDMEGLSAFRHRVYEAARDIPPGETLSYGELALRVGRPGAARAVGHALGRNPFALVVPCHRVVARDGGLVGFSAAGGVRTKERLLRLEGAL